MKQLLCYLALLGAPALADDAATASVADGIGMVEERPTIPTRTDDGLLITPIEMPLDYTREMLNIQMWQFKVEPPKDVTRETAFNYRLELRRPDQNPIELSSGGHRFAIYGKPSALRFTFGLMPEGKERFATSEKLRVYTAAQAWDAKSRVGEESGLGACRNPLKDLKIAGFSGGGGSKASVATDGTASLMGFETEDGSNYDTKLVLVLTIEGPQTEN